MTSRSSPIRASKSARKASTADGSPTSIPAAHACATSRQKPIRSAGRLRLAAASAMAASSATSTPSPKPLPAEFSRTIRAGAVAAAARAVDLGEDQREAVGEPLDARRHPAAAVRADVDVDEPRREPGRGPKVAGEDLDRASEEVLLGSGEVDEVRGVDRDRMDVERHEPVAEGRPFAGRRRTPAPGRRIVGEHLERRGPDLVRALDRLDHAAAQRQVGAEATSVGKHPRHGTTCGRRASLARSSAAERDYRRPDAVRSVAAEP